MAAPIKTQRPPRKYTPEYMRDGYISEANRQARRRMSPHLKPIDELLMLWAPEARSDGAPRWPVETMLARIINQTALGAAQSGSQKILDAPSAIEFADWAVASLRDVQRAVILFEYVLCPGLPAQAKQRRLGVNEDEWRNRLKESRECIYTLCRTYGRMLNVEIC